MALHRPIFYAALLLAVPSAGFGAAEAAGLFSPDREAAPPRPATRDLRVEAPGFKGGLRRGAPAAERALPPLELRSRMAEVDLGRLEAARLDAERRRPHRLNLNLFADAEFDAVFERSAATASGYTLTGRLTDEPMSMVALAVNGDWVAGTVWSPHGRYAVRPLGGGVAEVRQLDPSALGRCGVGDESAEGPTGGRPPPEAGPRSGAALPKSAPLSESFPEDDGSLIDLLVVYPSFARRSAGGHLAMRALIDSDVALANEMYRASGATQRLNLVSAVELPRRPGEGADRIMPDFLDRLVDGSDGHMDEAHALREAYAADMVLMHWGYLTGGGRGLTIGGVAGVAFQMEDLSGSYERLAFSVANSFAFAHELGHSMGLRHERQQDPNNTPFPYSHGYVVPDSFPELPPEREGVGWQTVMAAFLDPVRGIPRFSNPNLRYPGRSGLVIGVPGDALSDGADGPADAVRSLNRTRRVVANFRRSASRCRYQLSVPQEELPAAGGEFRIGVKAGPGCAWSAWSNDDFVTVAEGSRGVGDGEVVFRVSVNGGWEREMAVFVAGESYLAEQATVRERRVPPPVCERISAVRDAITAATGKGACSEVTPSDLASIRVLNLQFALLNSPLEDARYRHLPIGSLDGLTGLISLDLSYNRGRLTELTPGLFDGLLKLTSLDLTNNHLSVLRAGVFDGVPNLTRLDLWGNQNLATLEPSAFRGLSNMETLSLHRTGLTMLPTGAFDGLPNLYKLAFSAQSVDCTPPNSSSLNWECIVVPIPLVKVELGAFRGLSQLRELDVNHSTLTALQPGVFDGLPNLRKLMLSGNNGLTALQPELFKGLPNLRTLNLLGNSLNKLQPGQFDELPQLRYLYLNANGLETLQPGIFEGLAELNGLELSGNKLKTLEPGVFRGLAALEQLILGENQLQSLQPGVFDGLPRLWWLWLRDNKLATLHPNLFRGLGGLRQLNLDGNQLTALPPNLFRGLGSLWYVDLSWNRLRTVPPSLFDDQRKRMDTIKLGGNRLTNVDPGLFQGMASMGTLQLSDNGFAALPHGLFNELYGLLRMDLTGNPGAPFAFRPEFVRVEGASGSGKAVEVALELPQGAAFDLRVALAASGGSLSADESLIRVGRDRSGAVAVRPDGAGPVTLLMVEVSDVPGPPCEEIFYAVFASHCWKGVRTAVGAPLVLFGFLDQTLPPDGSVRFDLLSAFPDFPEGTTFAAELSDPVAEAVVEGGTLRVSWAGGGSATVTVAAIGPDGRRGTRRFEVRALAPPEAVGGISNLSVVAGESTRVAASDKFRDPDGGPLAYAAESSDPAVASVSVDGGSVGVAGREPGAATVTLTATDPDGLSATLTFRVTVVERTASSYWGGWRSVLLKSPSSADGDGS